MQTTAQHDKCPSYGKAATGIDMKVNLSPKEEQICDLLQQVSGYIAQERPDLPPVVARIAGGWVRDKLLGMECHDLDVAVNCLMGYDYAQFVNQYLKAQGHSTRTIAKIDSNPDKSKHLETATTKLYGLDIDFCNLRTEVYAEDSRIPAQVTFGSPDEDAYRRDITINSLFYNVHTRRVEDFTKKGLDDLRQGLIRTPLAPFETFRDDPLRVLRCIRFASRFDFALVPELRDAAKNEVIREALVHKISRERVGNEVDKMLSGPLPCSAVHTIIDLNLYSTVFSPPQVMSSPPADPSVAIRAIDLVESMTTREISWLSISKASERRSLFFAASLLPYFGVLSEIKNKPTPAVQLVLRDGLKAPNVDTSTIGTLFRGIPMLTELANQCRQGQTLSASSIGMVIRDLGSLWKTAVKLCVVKELMDASFHGIPVESIHDLSAQEVCNIYDTIVTSSSRYGIDDCYQWKHLLDGKRAAAFLGIKPGPDLAGVLKAMMIWQLDHPNGSEDECKDVILSYWQNR